MISLAVSKPQFEDTVNSILQKNEYRHLKNYLRDLIESAKEAISKWFMGVLQKTFANLDNVPAISNTLSTVFLIIGIIVFIGLLGFIIIKFDRAFEKKRRVSEILGEKIDAKTTPFTLRNKADKFALEGELRLGIRYSFIGLLLLMHERNLLYLDETKTNDEIYAYLSKNKFSSLKEFKCLIDVFNAGWYGHKDISENTYEVWIKQLEFLWNEVIRHEEKNK